MRLHWAHYLGDDGPSITAQLRTVFASDDLVFSFGGIGATPDDHTREAAANALGQDLVLHPRAAELITRRAQQTAIERGQGFDPHGEDHRRRLEMGRFPAEARLIANPYNGIPGFACRNVYFLPGFPVMAWPMLEAVLDGEYAHLHGRADCERAVIVLDSMESTLTPLMQELERRYAVKVFSLPSVDHPQYGRHIELGVKGAAADTAAAFAWMLERLPTLGARLGPEVGRPDQIAP